MKWRLAHALDRLRIDVDNRWPSRSKASDGSIGDASHASRSSDHNPWVKGADGLGIVTAIDITHDPAHGLDSEALAQALITSRDPRIKYVISNRKICSPADVSWKWRPYNGVNPHNHHVHISVKMDASHYDDTKPWAALSFVTPPKSAPVLIAADRPTLRRGAHGDAVKELQRLLRLTQDGEFGPLTEGAVRAAQARAKIVVDGVVGPYTWDVLPITTATSEPKGTSL